MQLHPKDTGGSFFEIDEQLGEHADDADGPWEPAGPGWQAARRLERVTGIRGAEIQCDDPSAVAARWAEIAELPGALARPAIQLIALDNATLRFVPCRDGRPEGLGGIDVRHGRSCRRAGRRPATECWSAGPTSCCCAAFAHQSV
jgi:hypothetical protein